MVRTSKYFYGVIGVLTIARNVNPDIGPYQEHFIDENFGFTVRLSNGTLHMSEEIALDYEVLSRSVTPDRIAIVAKSFIKKEKKIWTTSGNK
jgi:hypothetical protein